MLLLRLTVGLTMILHGSQRAFGVLGGKGWNASVDALAVGHGVPGWLASIGILALLVGGIAILLGLFARIASFGGFCLLMFAAWLQFRLLGAYEDMTTVIVDLVIYRAGFAAMCLALLIAGPGDASIDYALSKKKK